jgi:hypothetical protein
LNYEIRAARTLPIDLNYEIRPRQPPRVDLNYEIRAAGPLPTDLNSLEMAERVEARIGRPLVVRMPDGIVVVEGQVAPTQ